MPPPDLVPLPVLTCDGCGACCEEQGPPPGYLFPDLLPFLPEPLRLELAVHLDEERRTGRTRNERGLPCLWYDGATRRCRHYDLRPERCRAFPVGGEGCAFWRARRPPDLPEAPGAEGTRTSPARTSLVRVRLRRRRHP